MAPATSQNLPQTAISARADVALRCSILTSVAELEQLRPAWTELLVRSSSNEPTLSPDWLFAWWRAYGSTGGRTLQVAGLWNGSRLVGLAPLLKRRHWYLPGIPFARLEALGSGEREGEQVYSEYLNVICERGAEPTVANALADALTSGQFGDWDEFVIPHMDGDGPLPSLLIDAFRCRGVQADCKTTDAAPYAPLPVTWAAYLEALPSSRRYFLKRSLRDFEKWSAGNASYRHAATSAELHMGKQILVKLHNGRWSDGGRPGMFCVPRFRAFHDAVLPLLFDQGALELSWLTVRDEPIAALYNIVWNNKVYFYQSGRVTGLPANIRVGVVIQAFALRHAIEMGRREYDFLGPSAQYKIQLALGSRPLVQVRATRCPVKDRVLSLCQRGIRFAKSMRNAVRQRFAAQLKKPARPLDRGATDTSKARTECQLQRNIARG